MDIEHLRVEIDTVFPFLAMPAREELVFPSPRFIESFEIQEDMEEFRGREFPRKGIRAIHRYLPVLSDKGTCWIFPYLLRFCLSEEAKENSRLETQSLIFSLSPDAEFQVDTLRRFALLSTTQLICLAHFLEWCLQDEYWDMCSERIRSGIAFIVHAAAQGKGTG
jgi:hypothetical protein